MNRVQRVHFGKKYETLLHHLLEQVFQEKLMKTAEEYDSMDYEGESCWVELKVRANWYWPCQFKDWLLPYCKTQRAKKEEKNVYFVYYWTSTEQLFIIPYSSAFDSYVVDVPEWKQDKQLQVYVPSHDWEEITIED